MGKSVNAGRISCKIWCLISRTVSEDDAHRSNNDDRVSEASETNSSTQERAPQAEDKAYTWRGFARRSQSPAWSTTSLNLPKLKVSQSCDLGSCVPILVTQPSRRTELQQARL